MLVLRGRVTFGAEKGMALDATLRPADGRRRAAAPPAADETKAPSGAGVWLGELEVPVVVGASIRLESARSTRIGTRVRTERGEGGGWRKERVSPAGPMRRRLAPR